MRTYGEERALEESAVDSDVVQTGALGKPAVLHRQESFILTAHHVTLLSSLLVLGTIRYQLGRSGENK